MTARKGLRKVPMSDMNVNFNPGLLLLAIPLLMSLLAVLTGSIGVRRSREVGGKGKTASIAGLVMGGFATVMWGAVAALALLAA